MALSLCSGHPCTQLTEARRKAAGRLRAAAALSVPGGGLLKLASRRVCSPDTNGLQRRPTTSPHMMAAPMARVGECRRGVLQETRVDGFGGRVSDAAECFYLSYFGPIVGFR